MWRGKKVTIVFPCYNEEPNIRKAIEEFFAIGVVDEIIAVDNNSKDKTAAEINKTKAKYVLETKQGYGYALRRGMYEAKGDFIITCEPDGTFDADDVHKFLLYTKDADVIWGTRTSKSLIWSGAKMNWFLRIGNVVVAKLMEYWHNGPCLTDVGCTFKLINRDAYNKLRKKFSVGGSHFSPEFMVLAIRNNLRCLEIPVNYKERIGESTITTDFWKSFKLGMVMMWLIFKYRFKR